VRAETPDANGKPQQRLKVTLTPGNVHLDGHEGSAAFQEVLEITMPSNGGASLVRLSFWRDGLPIQAIPPQDYLRIPPPPGNA
jgi:hypothetical protein